MPHITHIKLSDEGAACCESERGDVNLLALVHVISCVSVFAAVSYRLSMYRISTKLERVYVWKTNSKTSQGSTGVVVLKAKKKNKEGIEGEGAGKRVKQEKKNTESWIWGRGDLLWGHSLTVWWNMFSRAAGISAPVGSSTSGLAFHLSATQSYPSSFLFSPLPFIFPAGLQRAFWS